MLSMERANDNIQILTIQKGVESILLSAQEKVSGLFFL